MTKMMLDAVLYFDLYYMFWCFVLLSSEHLTCLYMWLWLVHNYLIMIHRYSLHHTLNSNYHSARLNDHLIIFGQLWRWTLDEGDTSLHAVHILEWFEYLPLKYLKHCERDKLKRENMLGNQKYLENSRCSHLI